MKLKVLLLLAIVLKCEGHLRLLGDILSGAHDRIHSKVQDVAGTVLGGLSHGVNINIDGHFGINSQRRPDTSFQHNHNNYNPNKKPDTVVVIIKEEENQNNYRPPNHNQQPNRPPVPDPGYRPPVPDSGYRPINNYNPGPNQNNYPNGQGNNYGQPNIPNNGYPNNQYQGNGNQLNNEHNGYKPNINQNNNNYHQNNVNPNLEENNNYNQGNTNPGYGTNKPFPEKPTEFTKEPDYKPTEKPSKKDDDEPFFVPLNPNEYHYGGDSINVTAPKRETNNNDKAAEDGDYNIDIRIKDE